MRRRGKWRGRCRRLCQPRRGPRSWRLCRRIGELFDKTGAPRPIRCRDRAGSLQSARHPQRSAREDRTRCSISSSRFSCRPAVPRAVRPAACGGRPLRRLPARTAMAHNTILLRALRPAAAARRSLPGARRVIRRRVERGGLRGRGARRHARAEVLGGAPARRHHGRADRRERARLAAVRCGGRGSRGAPVLRAGRSPSASARCRRRPRARRRARPPGAPPDARLRSRRASRARARATHRPAARQGAAPHAAASRQLGADRETRRAAGRLGFEARGPAPRHAILVDDVHTTGATLSACARALKGAGAERVAALTWARTL